MQTFHDWLDAWYAMKVKESEERSRDHERYLQRRDRSCRNTSAMNRNRPSAHSPPDRMQATRK
jgi:hypothetical protein